jgi:cell division protein FtsB
MRAGIGLLSVLLVLLQVRLWVSDDGYREVVRLGTLITEQTAENARLAQRNQRLEAEVVELRKGDSAVEERARADLGLIGPDETFYLFGGARPTG